MHISVQKQPGIKGGKDATRFDGGGMRVLLVAGLAFMSPFAPTLLLIVGPFVAVLVFVFGRPLSSRITIIVQLMVAFAFWSFLSYLWAQFPENVIYSVLVWASLFIMFLGTVNVMTNQARVRTVAIGYILGCIFAVGRIIWTNGGIVRVDDARLGIGDLNQNYLGYAFATGFAVIALLWVLPRVKAGPRSTSRNRPTLLLIGIILIVGVELCGTRGSYLGLGCMLAWLTICRFTRNPPLRALAVVTLFSSVAIVFGFIDRWSLQFETGDRASGDWSGRLELWPMAREIWAENLVLGIGDGGFRLANSMQIGAHNIFLQTGTGLGIVGVCLIFLIFWQILKTRPASQPKRALLIGAFLATSAPAYLSGYWEVAPAAWITLALFAKINPSSDENHSYLPAPGRRPYLVRKSYLK